MFQNQGRSWLIVAGRASTAYVPWAGVCLTLAELLSIVQEGLNGRAAIMTMHMLMIGPRLEAFTHDQRLHEEHMAMRHPLLWVPALEWGNASARCAPKR